MRLPVFAGDDARGVDDVQGVVHSASDPFGKGPRDDHLAAAPPGSGARGGPPGWSGRARRRRSSANPVLHISGRTQRRAPRARRLLDPARPRAPGSRERRPRRRGTAGRRRGTAGRASGLRARASGSGDGARDRHDHYRVRAGAFQGAGARFRAWRRRCTRRRAGGSPRGTLAAPRNAEGPLDVFVPQDPGKPRLGNPLPGPRKAPADRTGSRCVGRGGTRSGRGG